jgi:long-chain acyl-CoA synthetase
MASDVDTEHEAWGRQVVETTVLGYPCLTFAKRRHNLSELLLDARRFPEREYLIQGGRRVSFAQHEEDVLRAATALTAHGIGCGDRVMLLGRNSVDWVVAFWAVLYVGGVVVLGNAWWSEDELAHVVSVSEPAMVLADDERLARVPDGHHAASLSSLLNAGADVRRSRAAVSEDEAAVILFTSGTTGLPKGAVLSHHGILSTMHCLALLTNRLPTAQGSLPPVSRALMSLPLFHIGGLQQVLNPMVMGGSLVFTDSKFDPEAVVALIEREQIRVWSAVPTMVMRVIDHLEDGGKRAVDSLRTLGMGGSPVVDELRRRVLTWFPNAARGLAVTYGLSEAGGVVTTGAGDEVRQRPDTVGRALATAMVRVADPDESGTGEILVRSPSVMLGYWRGANGTDDVEEDPITVDRWLKTGDIGRLDADGYLYITDRSKDIVIRGGENIATPHVENRLLSHPAVREVAVVGLPHASLGEELGAIVVLHQGTSVTEEQLRSFAAETLAYFEVPSRWRFRDSELPQNSIGKVLKRQLRDEWVALDAGPVGSVR